MTMNEASMIAFVLVGIAFAFSIGFSVNSWAVSQTAIACVEAGSTWTVDHSGHECRP